MISPRRLLLSTPSLGITKVAEILKSMRMEWTFNSLSRDHWRLMKPKGAKMAKTFNSLSRDHRVLRHARGTRLPSNFQLPLSGSRFGNLEGAKELSLKLSTPSLGITVTELSGANPCAGLRLSTPSLGITCGVYWWRADASFNSLSRDHCSRRSAVLAAAMSFQLPLSGSLLA